MGSRRTAVELITLIARLGKPGGVVFLLLAAFVYLVVFGVIDLLGDLVGWRATLFPVGLALTGAGAFALFGTAKDPRWAPLQPGELLSKMGQMKRPYCVCLDCVILIPFEASVGRCPRCESASSCITVQGEDDVKMVRAALS